MKIFDLILIQFLSQMQFYHNGVLHCGDCLGYAVRVHRAKLKGVWDLTRQMMILVSTDLFLLDNLL